MKAGGSSDRSLEHPIIWIAVIAGALGSILILKAVAWLAFPLILAIVLYYLVQPLLQSLQSAGVTPGQALGIFLGAAIVMTLIFSVTILPSMLSSLSEFQNQIPSYWDRLQIVIRDNLLALEGRFSFAKNAKLADGLEEQLNLFLASSGKEYVADVALFLLHWLPSLLLVPFLTFFFLPCQHSAVTPSWEQVSRPNSPRASNPQVFGCQLLFQHSPGVIPRPQAGIKPDLSKHLA